MDRYLNILYFDAESGLVKVRTKVNKWKFQDAMMGEQYIMFTITSEKPIDFSVGDICNFRGEVFTLNYVPSVTKKAGTGERQDAYTYENVKFDSYQEELTRCQMLDITATTGEYIAALGTNYTGSSKFQLFCGGSYANGKYLPPVCVLAAKMQANLDRMYKTNGWKIFVETTTKYTDVSGNEVLVTHTEDKALSFDNNSVAQALSEVHNIFGLDYCVRGRNVYIGYNLGDLTGDDEKEIFVFGYGKGYPTPEDQNKALFKIRRISNSQQQIVTRLRAFGSTKNLPYRYYNKAYSKGNSDLSQTLFPTNLQLPDTFIPEGLDTDAPGTNTKWGHNKQRDPLLRAVKGDTNDSYIDKNDNADDCAEGVREASARWDGSDSNLPEIYPTIAETTYGELRAASVQDQDGIAGASSFMNYGATERIDKLLAVGYYSEDKLVDDANIGDGILPESGISSSGIVRSSSLGTTYVAYNKSGNSDFTNRGNYLAGSERTLFSIQGVAPGNYAFAPTFGAVFYSFILTGNSTLGAYDVSAGFIITVKQKNVQTGAVTTIASYTSELLAAEFKTKEIEIPSLPDAKDGGSAQVSSIKVSALSDITVTFTPIIRLISIPSNADGFTLRYRVGNSELDKNVTYEPECTWFPIENSNTLTDTFHVFVQDMGFDFEACWTDETPILSMTGGRCVGREFEIGSDVQKVIYSGKKGYMLTLKRAIDSSLNTYYPNKTDSIASGDGFVLLGISMPDAYVKAAEVRLLRAATQYLADNCETQFTYQPYVDDIYLQRNIDMMEKEGTPAKSIFWRLYAGLKFSFRGVPSSEDSPAPLASITIEKVTISMGEGLTPKVELTLNDDVQQSTMQKLTTSVDRIYNGSLFGSGSGSGNANAAAVLSILQSEGEKLFLSKTKDDKAAGKIEFEDVVTHKEVLKAKKGLKIGNFQSRFLGSGALIDEAGNAEFESIYSRNFISTPEFRFNRIAVTDGEQWCTNGYGTIEAIERIDDTTGYITLKLEENDYASIEVGDICRGIYNDIAHEYYTPELDDDSSLYDSDEEQNDAEGEDKKKKNSYGFSSKAGFFTSYFWVKEMITRKKGECKFLYEIRNTKTPHPCEFMKFAQYGSFTNPERRSSSYSTSIGHFYEMVLDGVSTWTIKSANVVYRKGYLGNMTVLLKDGKEAELQGYGLYVQDNVYFGNAIVQLDPETLADIEEKLKSYTIDFSEYVNVITVDDVGNVIGGLYSVSGSGISQYRKYRIQSAISVRKNDIPLMIAEDGADADKGTYKIYVQPKGCTCVVENSTIYITSIDNIKDGVAGTADDTDFDYDAMREMSECSVDIIIDCEGHGSIQKSFPIRIKHDSQPYVGAKIDNEFSAVSWNTKLHRYIGLPVCANINMWHNNEFLDVTSVAVNGVVGATADNREKAIVVDDMTISTSLVTDTNNAVVANISIKDLPKDLEKVTNLNITVTAEYSGVSYERTFVHTINKSTDTNIYSVQPSVPEVIANGNDNAAQELSEDLIACDVVCNSSDDKHYVVEPETFGTHNIALYFQIFYANGTNDEEKPYTTAIKIDPDISEVRFILYGTDSTGKIDKTIVHDRQGVPVLSVGIDGKGVEYIFFLQNNETPVPTIYEEDDKRQADDYCPFTDETKRFRWTDDPSGVSEENKYEYYAQRKKVNGVWLPFGEVKEWNRYTVSPYTVEFSDHVDVITVDDVGNVLGGLYTLSGENNEYRNYRIHSAISVRLGQELLTIDESNSEQASEGAYKIHVEPKGCSCIVENSTLYITGIDHIKDGVAGSSDDFDFDYDAMRKMESCSVDITIDCEGKKVLVKQFPITIKHDSQPFVAADIDNEFSGVSWNTKTQSYIGLPIEFNMKMWHNNEFLDIETVNNVSVTPSIAGMTVEKSIVTNDNGAKVAKIRITSLPKDLALVTNLNVTCSAIYSGVSYERTLVHTINKSTDTNVYSLLPSVSEVVFNKNKQSLSANSINCSVICDSSDSKHYTVNYADFATHGIILTYKKYYTDGTVGSMSVYSNTAISIDSSISKIEFALYGRTNNSPDTSIVHDKEDVYIISEGEDGEGVEYIFFQQTTESPMPTIYDDPNERQTPNYCPYTNEQETAQWTDEPGGVGENSRFEFYAQRKKVRGVWQPFGKVRLWDKYPLDGQSPYMMDLTNEQSFVNCDEYGNVLSGYETSGLMIFHGNSYAFTDFNITITPTNIKCNGNSVAFSLTEDQKKSAQNSGTFTLTPSDITANSAQITIRAVLKTNASIILVSTYKINKNMAGQNGVIYSLMPSLNVVHKDGYGKFIDTVISFEVKKVVGTSGSTLSTAADFSTNGLTLKYTRGDVSTENTLSSYSGLSTSTLFGNHLYITLFLYDKDGKVVDKERINVVEDGENGVDYKLVPSTYAISFAYDSDGETLIPNSVSVHCGYIKRISDVEEESFDGTIIANLWREGGAPYNIFYRYHLKNGKYNGWYWNKDNANGTITINSSTDYIAIEFVMSTAYTSSIIQDDNIFDRVVVPITKDGAPAANYYLTSDIGLQIVQTYTGSFKGDAQPYITAWKKVGDADAVRLSDVVGSNGSVADGFTIYAREMQGSSVVYESDSPTGTLRCSKPYAYSDRIECTLEKNGKVYAQLTISIIQEVRGEKGDTGDGTFPRDRGIFRSGNTYYYRYEGGTLYRDMVRYQIGNIMYGFLVRKISDTGVTSAPSSSAGDSNWESSGIVETVIANTIFGENANIGGFMASALRLQSSNISYRAIYRGSYSSATYYANGTTTTDSGETIDTKPVVLFSDVYYTLRASTGTQSVRGQEPSNKSQYWRRATDNEIKCSENGTTGSWVDIYTLIIDGINGLIEIVRKDDSTWYMDGQGCQVIGYQNGKRIELDPASQSINVYDENGELCTTLSGDNPTSFDALFGSTSGTFSITPKDGTYSQSNGGTKYAILTSSNTIQIGSFGTVTTTKSRVTVTGSISSTAYTTPYDPSYASGIQEMLPITTDGNITHKADIYVRVVTWDSPSKINKLSSINAVSIVNDGRGQKKHNNFSVSVDVPAGYHTIEIYYLMKLYPTPNTTTTQVAWTGIAASIVSDVYMSRLLANGFAYGSSANNFFSALNLSKAIKLKARTYSGSNNFGFDLDNAEGFQIMRKGIQSPVFPTILYVYVLWSSSSSYSISSYFSYNGSPPSLSSVSGGSNGRMQVTMPTGFVGLTFANTIINVTAVNTSCINAHIYSLSSASVTIECNDDTSNNCSNFILEIRYRG